MHLLLVVWWLTFFTHFRTGDDKAVCRVVQLTRGEKDDSTKFTHNWVTIITGTQCEAFFFLRVNNPNLIWTQNAILFNPYITLFALLLEWPALNDSPKSNLQMCFDRLNYSTENFINPLPYQFCLIDLPFLLFPNSLAWRSKV